MYWYCIGVFKSIMKFSCFYNTCCIIVLRTFIILFLLVGMFYIKKTNTYLYPFIILYTKSFIYKLKYSFNIVHSTINNVFNEKTVFNNTCTPRDQIDVISWLKLTLITSVVTIKQCY